MYDGNHLPQDYLGNPAYTNSIAAVDRGRRGLRANTDTQPAQDGGGAAH